jgi:hypothetical protein
VTLITPFRSLRTSVLPRPLFSGGPSKPATVSVSPPADQVHFSGNFDPTAWQQRQAIAEKHRKEMGPVLQFLYPLNNKEKVGIKQMDDILKALKDSPLAVFYNNNALLGDVDSYLGKMKGDAALSLGRSSHAAVASLPFKPNPQYKLFAQAVESLGLPLKPVAVLALLNHFKTMGLDGGELREALNAYAELNQWYKEQPTDTQTNLPGFITGLDKSLVMASIALPVIKGIALVGPGVMKHEMDPGLAGFRRFAYNIDALSQDRELYGKVLDVCRLPASPGKSTADQYPRIVNLAYGLSALGAGSTAAKLLDTMKEAGRADYEPMAGTYVRALSLALTKNAEVDTSKWNLKYVHLLPFALRTPQETDSKLLKSYMLKKPAEIQALLKAALDGSYSEAWLHDASTPRGQANLKTKQAFASAGLDYNAWLHYPGKSVITLPDGKRLVMKLWERQPGKDIFQGTYGQSCSALNSARAQIAVDDMQYTTMQIVELQEEDTGKEMGNAMVYWAQDKNGAFQMVDNVQMKSEYRNLSEIKAGLTDYLKGYSAAVAGKSVPVRIGEYYNYIPTKDLKSTKHRFELLGETADGKYHMNSLLKNAKMYEIGFERGGQELDGTHKLDLRSLFEPAR